MPITLPDLTPLRLVLDTNVVMALWHFRDPQLASLAHWIATGSVQLVTRRECLEEFARVLAYRQFGIDEARQRALHADYAARAECLPDADAAQIAFAATLPCCRDKDDQKFVTLAWDGAAHALLTRDKLLLGLGKRKPFAGRFATLTPERMQALRAAV